MNVSPAEASRKSRGSNSQSADQRERSELLALAESLPLADQFDLWCFAGALLRPGKNNRAHVAADLLRAVDMIDDLRRRLAQQLEGAIVPVVPTDEPPRTGQVVRLAKENGELAAVSPQAGRS